MRGRPGDSWDETWDETVDLLIIGGGAAGMTAALVASLEGLRPLLCEKSTMVGGTTSTSAGTVWVPGTSQSVRAAVPDSLSAARAYLQSVVGGADGEELREAFLASGPAALDDLEARSEVKFAAAAAHPDYQGNHPGAAYGGRALSALPFDGRELGADFGRVRPPRPEFMILGGMMVAKTDIPHLLKPLSSLRSFGHTARMLARHAADRLRYRRGTHLVMGNALVARLLVSLRRRQVPIAFGTKLVELVRAKDRVAGAVIEGRGGRKAVRAKRGVVLATGGIGWNAGLRQRLFPPEAQAHSLSPQANTGDGLEAGLRIGATLKGDRDSAGLWMPCSILERPDGTLSVFPHIVLDRAKPGLIAVNSAGRRFVNEANSYHDFVLAMLRGGPDGPNLPAYLICDREFIRDYGIGLVHPGTRAIGRFVRRGYLLRGETPRDLAKRIGVDADGLASTIANHNRYAQSGVDAEFGRGSTDLNRINGDPANTPNPCMRPIAPGELFAVEVFPADLASSAGLSIDADARVLDESRAPIPGLYACGNDAASIFGGTYPGPGTTLGPALVFAWRLARHAAHYGDSAQN